MNNITPHRVRHGGVKMERIKIYGMLSTLMIVLLIIFVGCTNSATTTVPSTITTTSTITSKPTTALTDNTVSIASFAFSPTTLTVKIGTTITWTNNDSASHTVTSDSGAFDSGSMAQSKTFSYTFNQTGTFPYHCSFHPSMKATVIVQ
jgi:plastocyanin